MLETILRIFFFTLGIIVVFLTLKSAIRVFILPRAAPDAVAAIIFRLTRFTFNFFVRRVNTYSAQDRIMALFAPVALFVLLPYWLTLILIGYMFVFWSFEVGTWGDAFLVSGSSLFTLGFAKGEAFSHTALSFTEAAIGMVLVALLIAYLPTMYSAFSFRERAVKLLEVRAGSPPSAITMMQRMNRLDRLDELNGFWREWEQWFAAVEESHTSLAALVFFRSPQPDHSWVTAAGAVLDAAAFHAAVLDVPRDVQADLCLRAGYIALRSIADFFSISYNPTPKFPDDPISITRDEFDEAYDELVASGVPLKADREQAWHDFAGWRVNYDTVLIAIAAMTMAPYAPWSSDRGAIWLPPS
ncbi:MAG: hypothetical protein D6737_00045 [Chloroflexi bacterium]|nr:MAG: hypothetical protein D6737_00045 [Chloroflexota bacterium]